MIDRGMRPQLAHIVKQVYDSIATVPQTGRRAAPSDEDIKNYIAGVNRVMDAVTEWAGDNGRGGAWLASTAMRNLQGFRGAIDLSSFAKNDREDQRALLSAAFPDGYEPVRQELIAIGGNKVYAALQPSGRELNVAVKAVKDGWPESQEAWQRQGFSIIHGDGVKADASPSRHNIGVNVRFEIPNGTFSRTLKTVFVEGSRDTESPEVRSAIDQGLAEFAGRLVLLNKAKSVVSLHATEEEAKEAARSKVSRSGRKATVSDKGISVLAAKRIGADRRMPGEDISSDRLRDTFRFKGVNFGNWMKGDANTHERQLHLNHAFDSFMDLAEVLGVPPEAMSLNGILGVAIGAQGSGGFAAAHFVPGVNEINLTREAGAGSLAHEWGHALDHYFARQAGLTRATDPFLTEHLKAAAGSEIRPEILDKFKAIVQTMRKRPMTPAEAAARREEQLASAKRNLDGWLRSVLPGTTQEDEEIAKAVARIQSGDLGDGDIAISRTVAVKPAIADLAKLIKEKTGWNLGKTELAGIGASARNLQYQQSRTEDEAAHVPQQMVTTQYERDAQKLDAEKGGRKYWSTPLEMFARAFDAFVSDALEARAARNTYLSHAGRSGETVPSGSERTAINEAIKGLVDAVETRAGEDGNVVLFNRSELSPLPPSEWLSVGAITDQLEQLGQPFRTAIPVTVVDRVTDAIPGVAADDGVVVSGITYQGKIFIVREGVADNAAVERTFWHELLHFGLRRFMTRDQYTRHLGELYAQDEWIRNHADAWIAGEEGAALRGQGSSDAYIKARGVDEALAKLAEILQIEPTGYQTNTLVAKALRSVRSWIANLADFFGFHESAKAWRGYAAQGGARELVVSTFAKLREGADPSMMTTNWHYSDPAFMSDVMANITPADKAIYGMVAEGTTAQELLSFIGECGQPI